MRYTETTHDLTTSFGPMRTALFAPVGGRRWPGLVLYSEIFQITGPIARLARDLAGEGYVVAVPEVYYRHLPAGTMLAYDGAGRDEGNRLKALTTAAEHDAGLDACIGLLAGHAACTGVIGSIGWCYGGHLSFRAALHPRIAAAVCCYGTDLHSGGLGGDDPLARAGRLTCPVSFIWGRQDPHIPQAGRLRIQAALDTANATYEWHEFQGAHAFMRDEGDRHDPALARLGLALAGEFLGRHLQGIAR